MEHRKLRKAKDRGIRCGLSMIRHRGDQILAELRSKAVTVEYIEKYAGALLEDETVEGYIGADVDEVENIIKKSLAFVRLQLAEGDIIDAVEAVE